MAKSKSTKELVREELKRQGRETYAEKVKKNPALGVTTSMLRKKQAELEEKKRIDNAMAAKVTEINAEKAADIANARKRVFEQNRPVWARTRPAPLVDTEVETRLREIQQHERENGSLKFDDKQKETWTSSDIGTKEYENWVSDEIKKRFAGKEERTGEYWQNRYEEVFAELSKEHKNDHDFPVAVRAEQIVSEEKERHEYVTRYENKKYGDDSNRQFATNYRLNHLREFGDQFSANYDLGRLQQDSYKAWNDYVISGKEEDRVWAETLDSLINTFQSNNIETLTEDARLPWISRTMANYLPQLIDQTKASAAGVATGLAASMFVPVATPVLVKAGAVAGSGAYSYSTMRGAAYKGLRELGVDEATARKAAGDEALLAALTEMADTGLDIATLGFGSLLKSLGKGAVKTATTSAVAKALKALAKYGVNIGGEYAEEAIQEGISIANERRTSNGKTGFWDLANDTGTVLVGAATGRENAQTRKRMHEAGKEGAKIATMMGAPAIIANTAATGYLEKTAGNSDAISRDGSAVADGFNSMYTERNSDFEGELYDGKRENDYNRMRWVQTDPARKQVITRDATVGGIERNGDARWTERGRSGRTVWSQDSEGREIEESVAQRLQGKVVVDSDGNPKTVYHATNVDFSKFEKGDVGFHFGEHAQAQKRAADKGIESPIYVRAYLKMGSPLETKTDFMNWHANSVALHLWNDGILTDAEKTEIEKLWSQGSGYGDPASVRLRELLEAKGYDGIAYPNEFEGQGYSYMVFHDEQIVRTDPNDNIAEANGGVRSFTGYGENGRRAFADAMETRGDVAPADVALEFEVPYQRGLLGQNENTVKLDTPLKQMAYNAGQLDYMATQPKARATSGTAAPASTAVTVQSVAERLMDAGTDAETATVLANDLHTLATTPNTLGSAAQNRIRSNPAARQIEYELREQVITFADRSTDSTVEETADLGYTENRMLGDLNDEGAINYETRLAETRGRTQEGDAGTRAETDERPRVSEKIGRKQGAAQEDYLGLREKGIIESDAAEYGVPLNFVAPENWPDKHKGVPAFARGGQIFVIADFAAAEIANGLVPHEVAHVMRQLRFGAYLNLLDRVPDMINRTNDSGWDLLRGAAAHRGIDLFGGATAEQVEGVYDEIIALVSSVAIKDIDGHMLKNLREAFYDYDAFKAELKAVHQQFKKARRSMKEAMENGSRIHKGTDGRHRGRIGSVEQGIYSESAAGKMRQVSKVQFGNDNMQSVSGRDSTRHFTGTQSLRGVSGEVTTASEHDDSPIMADRSGKQKNTTEKSGGKKYSLRAYSERQIENWKSSPKIVVYDGPESLKHFVNKAINDGQFNGKMYFGIVDGDLAGAIRMQTGLTLAGRNVTLRAGNVRKILKSHGNEQTESAREQRAITVRDFALIPEVIAEPDGIFRENGEEYRGKPALLFKKTVAGSEVTILAVDSGGSLDLFVQTMYASKKKESIANVTDEKTPIITSETSVGTAPTRSIPQKRELVNGKTSANDDGVQHETATATATKVKNERWDAERVGDPNVAPKSLSEIVEGIRHDFGINITKGHIRGKGVRGQYNTRNHGIRSRVVNNLPTIAHELGHHLDTVYRMMSGLSRAEIAELHGGLSDATKEAYAQNKWTAEGIAEYLRRYLQNSDEAALAYPGFTKYFKNTLSEKDLALIERLADDVNAYYALDADTATSTIRLQEEGGYDARTAIEKLKDKAKVLYAAWFDSNRGIREFDKATGANTYKLATNSAYADAIAGQIVVGDLTDVNGQYVAPGLKTVLSGLDLNDVTEYRLFGEYLTVKHGPERLAEGMRIFADDRKNTVEFMQRRLATLERQFPQFAEISERLYEFQKQFLQTWGVETGLVSREASLDWADRWAYYVPLNRAVSMEKRGIGARRGYANQNSTIKQARGSGLDIVHPVDNIINNIVKMVNAGVRNNVMRAITKADTDALFLEKVPTPMVRKGFDMTGVKDDLLSMLEESGMNDNEQKKAQQIITTLDDVLFQYSRGKAFGDVVTVMKDGKPEFWKINDPLLLESVTNMRPKTLEGVLGVLASINRFMTGNITGSNIVWSLFSNAPRDIMTFFTYSKNRNPVKTFSTMGSAYLNKMRDDTHRDPLYLEYLAMGGGHSSMYTADRNMVKDARKKLRGRNLRKVSDWVSPMECVSWISDAIESGPRFAAYKLARQSGLSPQEAFYEAMDVTVNFRRGGRLARQVNYFVPFFNAGVQGQDKFRRWITASDAPAGDRAKVCAKRTVAWLGVNAAVAILVYALNHMDEEKEKDYEQLSNHTKNSYWCIPLGDGKYFAITKNRELATPSSLFERVMEYSLADNKHAFDGFYEYATNQWLPNVVSDLAQGDVYGAIGSLGIVGTGSYMMANRDFLGRPIVSQSMMNLEPKDQYTKRTTQVAYWIGQAFDVSPIQVDFLLDSTLGGFQDANAALFPVDGNERDWSLGVRNTYIKDNQYSTDLSNWIYDKAEASKIAYNSDQADMDKAITYKMDSNMTTFYSNYNKLAKGSSDTRQSRITRQAVFDMLSGYQKAADSGYTTKAQRAVYNACKTHGKTELLPSVMNPVVRDGNNKQHTLSATQYVEYQTDYNRLYWEYVEENMSVTTAQTKKVAILKAAKDVASEKAKNRVLARIGAPQTAFATRYSGVEDSDVVYFRAALDLADEDGGLKQEEVKTIIAEMVRDGLEKEDAYTLFHSKYESDKNNPWRRYQ